MSMNLSVINCKEFCIDDLFNVEAGKYHYPEEYDDGCTPYVSASNINNGIAQKIDLPPDFAGNCITTGKVGCTAFYQPVDFCATSDVNILTPKNFVMNEKIGLFITSVINASENYKWNYGRQCRVGDSKEIVIKLPIKIEHNEPVLDDGKFSSQGYIPDFDFMENYVESLHHKPITTANKRRYCSYKFDQHQWEEFKLGNLFEKIYKAKAHVKAELETFSFKENGSVSFVTRTELNNGCDCFIKYDDLPGEERENAIIIGDTTATCFYQGEKFYTGDHIIICRANWVNKYTALFLKAVLEIDRYRYSYGRAFKMDLVKETCVKLPSKNHKPDWKFMENYIKNLPYGERI